MSSGSTMDPLPVAERAPRLLQAMQQVCSHDLPNQTVALESLLHLLAMDEAERLSPQATEYLDRLKSVARKIAGMSQFLRDIIRLRRHDLQFGELAFARLLTELKGELQRHLPEHAISWQAQLGAAAGWADHRLVLTGVSALVQAAAEVLGVRDLEVTLATRSAGDCVVCTIRVNAGGSPIVGNPVASAKVSGTTNVERGLEYALACEYLAFAGIACRHEEAADPITFSLTFPQRSPHG